MSQEHLGRDVGECPDEEARIGHRVRLRGLFGGAGRRPAREPEIEYLGRAFRADGHVRGLQVAVNHAALVRVRQRGRDLLAIPDDRFGRQAVGRDDLRKRLALDELHRDEGPAVELADFVHRADVRMVEV